MKRSVNSMSSIPSYSLMSSHCRGVGNIRLVGLGIWINVMTSKKQRLTTVSKEKRVNIWISHTGAKLMRGCLVQVLGVLASVNSVNWLIGAAGALVSMVFHSRSYHVLKPAALPARYSVGTCTELSSQKPSEAGNWRNKLRDSGTFTAIQLVNGSQYLFNLW